MSANSTKRSRGLFLFILLLFLVGLGSSLYLTNLYVRVNSASGQAVESFCAVSDKVNCVTVANSRYSTFLGIPISVYGMDFYLVAIAILLLTLWKPWPLKTWESLAFYLAAASIPICAFLGYLSAFVIRSVCIMCCAVYAVNLLVFLILLVANRGGIGELLASGPREIIALLAKPGLFRKVFVVFMIVAFSQFAWMPFLFRSGASAMPAVSSWQGLPAKGLALGHPDAPVFIEEFTDFQCPFCGKAHRVIMELIRNHPDKIRLEHRDTPLDISCNPFMKRPFHPDSCRAALYARCAAEQNEFWPFEEKLFSNRHNLKKHILDSHVKELGLNTKRFAACLKNPKTMEKILDDLHEGKLREVRGTPTFFVNGERIVGYKPLEFWENKIAEILGGKGD